MAERLKSILILNKVCKGKKWIISLVNLYLFWKVNYIWITLNHLLNLSMKINWFINIFNFNLAF